MPPHHVEETVVRTHLMPELIGGALEECSLSTWCSSLGNSPSTETRAQLKFSCSPTYRHRTHNDSNSHSIPPCNGFTLFRQDTTHVPLRSVSKFKKVCTEKRGVPITDTCHKDHHDATHKKMSSPQWNAISLWVN